MSTKSGNFNVEIIGYLQWTIFFQNKCSSGKKQENLPIYNTSWECRVRVTLEGFSSDVNQIM